MIRGFNSLRLPKGCKAASRCVHAAFCKAADLQIQFSALYLNPEKLRLFLRSMTGHSLPSAMAIAHKFPWQQYKTFVDVGTAEGFARASP
jgi:hypothetical protein